MEVNRCNVTIQLEITDLKWSEKSLWTVSSDWHNNVAIFHRKHQEIYYYGNVRTLVHSSSCQLRFSESEEDEGEGGRHSSHGESILILISVSSEMMTCVTHQSRLMAALNNTQQWVWAKNWVTVAKLNDGAEEFIGLTCLMSFFVPIDQQCGTETLDHNRPTFYVLHSNVYNVSLMYYSVLK